VLLDEQMPGLSGLEVVERVRANPALGRPAIMMLSSSDQDASAVRCRELGVETYLMKPIKLAELLLAIRRVLGAPPHQEVVAPAGLARGQHALCILVAEDNLVNQKLAVTMLQKMGHQVTLAVNGVQVCEKWRDAPYDVIFMDVQMPEKDGYAATRCIREQEKKLGTHVHIIAMTAHAMSGDRERCLQAGMDDYISKPISRKTIENVLEKIRQNAASPSSLAEPAAEKTSSTPPIQMH